MFNLLIRFFLIGGLIFIIPSRPDGDENIALVSMMVIVLTAFMFEPKRRINLICLTVPFVFAAFTLFFSRSVVCISSVKNLFVALVAIKVLGERFDMNYKSIGIWLSCFFLANLVLISMQFDGLDKTYAPYYSQYGVSGTMGLPWVMGCLAVLALPFIMEIKPVYGLLIAPFLWLSHSSVCILAALAVLAVFSIRNKKTLFLTMALSPTAVFVYALKDGFDENRIQVWTNGLSHFGNLFIGKGLGTWAHSAFYHVQGGISPMWWRWAHNEFYQQGYEQGYIGLALMLVACLTLYFIAKSRTIKSALVGLYILCLFHPVLHWGKLTFFVCFIVASALAESRRICQPRQMPQNLGYTI